MRREITDHFFLHLAGRLVIERLQGTVPAMEELTGWATRSQKEARKRRVRRKFFEELGRLVGPWNETRIYELKILDNGEWCPSACSLGVSMN